MLCRIALNSAPPHFVLLCCALFTHKHFFLITVARLYEFSTLPSSNVCHKQSLCACIPLLINSLCVHTITKRRHKHHWSSQQRYCQGKQLRAQALTSTSCQKFTCCCQASLDFAAPLAHSSWNDGVVFRNGVCMNWI